VNGKAGRMGTLKKRVNGGLGLTGMQVRWGSAGSPRKGRLSMNSVSKRQGTVPSNWIVIKTLGGGAPNLESIDKRKENSLNLNEGHLKSNVTRDGQPSQIGSLRSRKKVGHLRGADSEK